MNTFQHYIAKGFCVIPIGHDGIPAAKWTQYQTRLPTMEEAAEWDKFPNVALVCGHGIVAVDIDTSDTDLIQRIESLAGVSMVNKIGSKGYTAFFQHNDEPSKSWKKDGKVICELLSDKRLTTIPPSKHRVTGKPYEWAGAALGDAPLPKLKDDFILLMDAKFGSPPEKFKSYSYDHEDIEIQKAEEMLYCVNPDCSRDEWVQIGMALRHEYGDAARGLWHKWSSGSPKYKQREADSAWRSFNGNGVTIGTLVYFAKQGGWVSMVEKIAPSPAPIPRPTIEALPAPEPVKVGGLVGAIADWITSTAIVPQPQLSLAAAITFIGMVKGHRVQSVINNARTNVLVISLAPTGGGKEHPQLSINTLANHCGLDKHMMGRPTSGTGLLTGLHKANRVGLLCIDEIGRYVSMITHKNAGGYQKEIADYIIQMFSVANRTFRGNQYANEKANPSQPLEQPHLCCIGSTVPERLKAACTSAEVIDGFLNRWMLFVTKERPKKVLGKKDFNPPKELVGRIKEWMNKNPVISDTYGNISPKEIEFTPEAWDLFTEYDNVCERRKETMGYPMNELLVRATEHVTKLATLLTDDDWVGIPEIKAAVAIVEESCKNICEFADGISDNQHESNVVYVLNAIRKFPEGATRSQITQVTRKLSNKERGEIVNQLVEAGDIEQEKNGKTVIYKVLL